MSSAALENLDIEYWDIANQFRLIDASSNPPNFDRVSSVNYGDGKIKNFTYDSWGKVLEISAIDGEKNEVSKESFKYDEFDRIAGKAIVKTVKDVEKEKLVYEYSYTPSGKRLSVAITFPDGSKKVTKNLYDKYGRLAETVDGSRRVSYKYDDKTARLKEQNINGIPVFYTYTKLGQLESKVMGDVKSPISTLKYFYTKDGQITAREVNGKRQNYEYDVKGQLLAVKDSSGNAVEKYAYDLAGNILSKTVDGKTVTYSYDESNQLISAKTADGKETSYRYDAAGRLTEESGVSATKEYTYGWLDKVMKVREQDKTTSFSYHVDGQLAERSVGSKSERFFWDGLALVRRDDTNYLNEPSVTGGNPILADDKVMFNDMLGNTLGIYGKDLQEVKRTSFGSGDETGFFTGKPYVKELGAVFLFRNYRSDLGKWQTSDPLGYPDGWNNFAYCSNKFTNRVDPLGLTDWVKDGSEPYVVGRVGASVMTVDLSPGSTVLAPIEDYGPNMHRTGEVHDALVDYLTNNGVPDLAANTPTMVPAYLYALTLNLYETGEVGLDYSIDTGTEVSHYINTQISDGWNWTTDNINDFFNPPNGVSFWDAFVLGWTAATYRNGKPE